MPKSMSLDPKDHFKRETIQPPTIEICSYQKSVNQEQDTYTKAQFLEIYEDMAMIREFETMLTECKLKKSCYDLHFAYQGAAHMAIGEEAAAVGEAFLLSKDDFIFGNHRSHHEILAKAFSALRKMSDQERINLMVSVNHGNNYDVIRNHLPEGSPLEQAESFFLFSFMCELFSKRCGFTHGLGGSMHTAFPPLGIYPNNGIVGASAPIAVGAALFKKIQDQDGAIICNLGDAAAGRGSVYEAINFAGMGQFDTLWETEHKGGLPIIFNFTDNAYGMGDRTQDETMAYAKLASLGLIHKSGMASEAVNGFDPLAVIDAYRRKLDLIKNHKGPILLVLLSYRYSGHSSNDADAYRNSEEIEAWRKIDPLLVYPQKLIEAKIATPQEIDAINQKVRIRNRNMFRLAIDETVAPLIDPKKEPDFITKYLYSNQSASSVFNKQAQLIFESNPRIKALRESAGTHALTVREAIYTTLLKHLLSNPKLILYGEDVRDWGGCFDVTRELSASLPYHRFFNAPISESAIVGSAIGYAMAGGRTVIEIMYQDFMVCCMDEILNQLAKWQAMSAGAFALPIVLRSVVGAKHGAQHTQDLTAFWAHIPGLKVVYPVTPMDAVGLLEASLNGSDPVLFIESQLVYDKTDNFESSAAGSSEIQFGQPALRRTGSDLTILTLGPILYRAMDAAKQLSEYYGIEAEVIDMRSVVPFDSTMVIASLNKTGKIILASDEVERGSSLKDVAQNLTRSCFSALTAAPIVIGSKNWIAPADEYDTEFFPQVETFMEAVNQLIPLKGFMPKHDLSPQEHVRQNQAGL